MSMYATIVVITELMMLAMTLHVISYKGFTKSQRTWYILTFTSIMFCYAAEFIAKVFDGRGPSFVLPLTVLTVIQFALSPFLSVFLSGALGLPKYAKRTGCILLANVIVEIICAPFGLIFYFDQQGRYFHGEYYVIYEGFYLISVIILVASLILAGRKFNNRDAWTIGMVLVVTMASIIPLILYSVHAAYLGIAITACLCYIYYNDLVQQDVQTELIENQKRVRRFTGRIVYGLANLIESRDFETGEHVTRTSAYVRTLSRAAKSDGVYADELTDDYITLISNLAPLHDVGKIVVSDSILRKPGKLTDEEFEEMKRHAPAGGEIIRDILLGIATEEQIEVAAQIATYHHERWDGRGYPEGLKGEEIPLCARIMAVADVYDALIAERCYKKPMPVEKALSIIEEEAGTHFDPLLAEVFIRHKEEFV